MRRRRLIGGSMPRSLVFALGGSWRSEIAARAAAFFPRASLSNEVVSQARFSLNVTEAACAAECSTVNTSDSFATCCRSWGQKSLGMQLPFVNVNIMKGPF